MRAYVTYAIGVPWSGYPVQKTQKQLQKLAQRFQYPDTKEEKEEAALAILQGEKEEAALQDGYEVDARPASQPCPVHTAMEIAGHSQECRCALESRPLF